MLTYVVVVVVVVIAASAPFLYEHRRDDKNAFNSFGYFLTLFPRLSVSNFPEASQPARRGMPSASRPRRSAPPPLVLVFALALRKEVVGRRQRRSGNQGRTTGRVGSPAGRSVGRGEESGSSPRNVRKGDQGWDQFSQFQFHIRVFAVTQGRR